MGAVSPVAGGHNKGGRGGGRGLRALRLVLLDRAAYHRLREHPVTRSVELSYDDRLRPVKRITRALAEKVARPPRDAAILLDHAPPPGPSLPSAAMLARTNRAAAVATTTRPETDTEERRCPRRLPSGGGWARGEGSNRGRFGFCPGESRVSADHRSWWS